MHKMQIMRDNFSPFTRQRDVHNIILFSTDRQRPERASANNRADTVILRSPFLHSEWTTEEAIYRFYNDAGVCFFFFWVMWQYDFDQKYCSDDRNRKRFQTGNFILSVLWAEHFTKFSAVFLIVSRKTDEKWKIKRQYLRHTSVFD